MRASDKIPAFLFDLDGTLVDSVYQHVLAWREALERTGIELAVWRIHRRIGMSGGLLVNALMYLPPTLWLQTVPYTGHRSEGIARSRGGLGFGEASIAASGDGLGFGVTSPPDAGDGFAFGVPGFSVSAMDFVS